MYRTLFIHTERSQPWTDVIAQEETRILSRIAQVDLLANLDRVREQEYAVYADAQGIWAVARILHATKNVTVWPGNEGRVSLSTTLDRDLIPDCVQQLVGTEKPWTDRARFRYAIVDRNSTVTFTDSADSKGPAKAHAIALVKGEIEGAPASMEVE